MTRPYFEDEAVTIYHGDCREVLPLLDSVALVLTDPPYGCGVQYGLAYQDAREGYWEWFLPVIQQMRALGRVVALTHRNEGLAHIRGWDWVGVWDKQGVSGARMGNSPVLAGWEPVFLFGIHSLGVNGPGLPDVLRYTPTGPGVSNGKLGREVWATGPNLVDHPVPKPLGLFRKLASCLSWPGDVVLDPFMGSGTTLRAAKDLGRKAIGIEVEERYCEIAAKRMAQGVLL